MKGKYKVIVRNNKLHYEFEIKRNITIIQGDSATGKTTLINMLRQAENLGESSGVDVLSNVPCRILEGVSWCVNRQCTKRWTGIYNNIVIQPSQRFQNAGQHLL